MKSVLRLGEETRDKKMEEIEGSKEIRNPSV